MPTFAAEKLATWTGGTWSPFPTGPLRGFTQDTRTLAAGQVFVALSTGKRDGHDFLGEARARGAAAALVGRPVTGDPLPQLVVADPLAAFQQIAREHRREFHGPVVGVTGSVGKTSTKDLLALLLGGVGPGQPAAGPTGVLATAGNLNNHLGIPLTLTRLDPAAHRMAVVEAGINSPGEMRAYADMIEPDHAIVTLVAPAHLEKLGSLAGVAEEKVTLLRGVRRGGLQVFPVACWQHPVFHTLEQPLILVPENEGMTRVTGRTVKFNVFHRPERTELRLDGRRTFILRRVSAGMAQNTALALALASELGVDDATLQARLEQWVPTKWRGEVRRHGEATVYADFYNANPASMADAVDAFNGAVRADLPRLYVLGCMEELGAAAADYHRQFGRTLLLRPGDHLLAIGDQAAALREGLLQNGNDPSQVAVITDLAPVRERLTGFTGAVFLKGSRRYQLETLLEPQTTGAH
ncbi:UDP-N-acetylmuramoyl-tripeptide--D-alanyl-D-alanine ligase [Lacunisphaera limnophila]|uniref:UDP-N-acetylmuramoyl-tripeptide--D-alanyl-D-alanine ligase n=1 Tax=Lacunisphaera limnophila TaxID=1838286 RepID=A0A1D8AZV4_9BACT|nr:Mur ligase family protein [Lacunisphaera limnophila]AOS46415.1 UDP-N-acetylmuramoyl-tripeptide--D-alanyl-D-alanine ligase [Lacunisphaera limnophila]